MRYGYVPFSSFSLLIVYFLSTSFCSEPSEAFLWMNPDISHSSPYPPWSDISKSLLPYFSVSFAVLFSVCMHCTSLLVSPIIHLFHPSHILRFFFMLVTLIYAFDLANTVTFREKKKKRESVWFFSRNIMLLLSTWSPHAHSVRDFALISHALHRSPFPLRSGW